MTSEPAKQALPSSLLQWRSHALDSEARTLAAEMYTSPEIYRLEQKYVFGKTWFYVGHISQLQGPGSYFTVDIAEQPLVILQNRSGELRAFFNVCSHRAGPVAIDSGRCTHLTCHYHAWSFDLDGNLRGMPDMETAEGFDCASHGLTAVNIDTWGPFIFVNLDPTCAPLSAQLGELPELFDRYNLSNLARVHSVDYWSDVNWKVYTENTVESYHEPFVHKETWGKYYECTDTTAEARHYYYLQYAPFDSASWLTSTEAGIYIDTLNEYELNCAQMVCLFPNFTLVASPTYCVTFLFDPQGLSKTRMRMEWLVPNTEVAKSPENVEPLITFFDDLMQEDLKLLPTLQKGIQSMGFRPGRLSPKREMGVHLFQELVMKHIVSH
ncbi:aromatic ring-hydroxylating dioxygenase subunit alpha [Leptolyngbya sp. FACHB-36]|nr:aromatic ring-hydroxylating dioxygenase subunit alpha [Leptolyngbya sp. FACHB-36]